MGSLLKHPLVNTIVSSAVGVVAAVAVFQFTSEPPAEPDVVLSVVVQPPTMSARMPQAAVDRLNDRDLEFLFQRLRGEFARNSLWTLHVELVNVGNEPAKDVEVEWTPLESVTHHAVTATRGRCELDQDVVEREARYIVTCERVSVDSTAAFSVTLRAAGVYGNEATQIAGSMLLSDDVRNLLATTFIPPLLSPRTCPSEETPLLQDLTGYEREEVIASVRVLVLSPMESDRLGGYFLAALLDGAMTAHGERRGVRTGSVGVIGADTRAPNASRVRVEQQAGRLLGWFEVTTRGERTLCLWAPDFEGPFPDLTELLERFPPPDEGGTE